ncbi:MAG: hypothetical protein IKE92_06695 [Clostridiales bacterium]|nr:hypothetical protein [Clostridiales bacterium]
MIQETPSSIICEKCGTVLIKELPEDRVGTYCVTCPNCGWVRTTANTDPKSVHQTRYSVFLMEGNDISVEVVRAVNQVSHQNLLKSKELIMNAPQLIFEGDALEVYDMMRILDAGFVEYKVIPDYPYV